MAPALDPALYHGRACSSAASHGAPRRAGDQHERHERIALLVGEVHGVAVESRVGKRAQSARAVLAKKARTRPLKGVARVTRLAIAGPLAALSSTLISN